MRFLPRSHGEGFFFSRALGNRVRGAVFLKHLRALSYYLNLGNHVTHDVKDSVKEVVYQIFAGVVRRPRSSGIWIPWSEEDTQKLFREGVVDFEHPFAVKILQEIFQVLFLQLNFLSSAVLEEFLHVACA